MRELFNHLCEWASSMGKAKFNENYQHSCNSVKYSLEKYRADLSKHIAADEYSRIISFYLTQAPIQNKNTGETFGPRSLMQLGWCGNSDLNALESKLLTSSSISSFLFLKSSSINATLQAMNLEGEICIEHPRCVIQRTVKKLRYNEDGTIACEYTDSSRMQCLFRHIRNGIAHGRTCWFDNGMILIEDIGGDGKTLTARILLSKDALLRWIDIVENEGPTSKTKSKQATKPSSKSNESNSPQEKG